jgi:hypothetical protein
MERTRNPQSSSGKDKRRFERLVGIQHRHLQQKWSQSECEFWYLDFRWYLKRTPGRFGPIRPIRQQRKKPGKHRYHKLECPKLRHKPFLRTEET